MTAQTELIERIALALKGVSDSMGVVRTWKDYAPAILPIITAEREAGRLEGARAMQEAAEKCAPNGLKWGTTYDRLCSLDPAEIVKGL